jgi:hypothetical protein
MCVGFGFKLRFLNKIVILNLDFQIKCQTYLKLKTLIYYNNLSLTSMFIVS